MAYDAPFGGSKHHPLLELYVADTVLPDTVTMPGNTVEVDETVVSPPLVNGYAVAVAT